MALLIVLLQWAFEAYYFLLLARVLISWLAPLPYRGTMRQIASVIYLLTEPVLAPIRRLLPMWGGLDFSPVIAMVLLAALQRAVIRFLASVW
ncbi:MAG: YggT family protein [Bacillota bacterium]